jgi:hypothetical protein
MGFIREIKEFVVNRGFTLMLVGITTAAVGVAMYAFLNTPRYAAFYYPQSAVGLAFLGIAIYLVGRISVQMQRNDNKRKAMELIRRREEEAVDLEPPLRSADAAGNESFEPPPRNDGESGAK